MRKIDLIVIHCSATRENTDYSPKQLESDHKARGSLGGLKRRRDDLAG